MESATARRGKRGSQVARGKTNRNYRGRFRFCSVFHEAKDASDWTTTAKYPVDLGYGYTPDPPQCLKTSLASVADAGKGLATLKCNCN